MAALTLATGLYLGASSATVSVSAATAPSVPSLPALPAASGGTTGVRQSQVPPVPE